MRPLPKVRCRPLVLAAAAVLPFLPLEPRAHWRAPRVVQARRGPGGLRVAVDPITGLKVLPDVTGSMPQLQDALQQSGRGLTIVQRSDGSQYVELHGRFMCGIAVQVVDGHARQVCTDADLSPGTARVARAATPRAGREVR